MKGVYRCAVGVPFSESNQLYRSDKGGKMLRDATAGSTAEQVAALDTRLDDGEDVAGDAVTRSTIATAVETEPAVVAVVGLGYVGLPTAIALRNAGCRIVGLDNS